jgi:hypothetical protein
MNRRTLGILTLCVLVACAVGATLSSSASAAPSWKFEGSELIGTESIAGSTGKTSLVSPGLITACEGLSYGMTIFNSAGVAKGKVNEMAFKGCASNLEECAIESVVAEKLAWPLRGVVVSASSYVVLEGVRVAVHYVPNENCVLDGVVPTYTGTAGGLYGETGTFTFDSSSFAATGTALKALGSSAQWNGTFTTEALGPHAGQVLRLK